MLHVYVSLSVIQLVAHSGTLYIFLSTLIISHYTSNNKNGLYAFNVLKK